MGTKRTAWHFFFCILLRRYGPASFEIRDEVPLSEEPPRVDYLLLRRRPTPADAAPAQTLCALWPLLPEVTIAELKSTGRPYQRGELDRLWSYAHAYQAAEQKSLSGRGNLGALLLVPRRTPSLDEDAAEMGLRWTDLGGGYWALAGGLFAMWVVEIDAVADQPEEDLLVLYSHHQVRTLRATRFWGELRGAEANMDVRNLEGYDEIEVAMNEIPLEVRLRGVPPEQIVKHVPQDQLLLALSDEALRALSDDYVEHLPPATAAAIRKRLGKA